MAVFIRMTSVFLAEIGQGDRKTYLEGMADGEAEDLMEKYVICIRFAFSYLFLHIYMYVAMTHFSRLNCRHRFMK